LVVEVQVELRQLILIKVELVQIQYSQLLHLLEVQEVVVIVKELLFLNYQVVLAQVAEMEF
jgi:hypothetical protein